MIGMFSQEDDGVTIWGPARGRSPLPQQVFLFFTTSSPYPYTFPSFILILTFRLPAWPLPLLSSGQLPLAVLNFQEVPAISHMVMMMVMVADLNCLGFLQLPLISYLPHLGKVGHQICLRSWNSCHDYRAPYPNHGRGT